MAIVDETRFSKDGVLYDYGKSRMCSMKEAVERAVKFYDLKKGDTLYMRECGKVTKLTVGK